MVLSLSGILRVQEEQTSGISSFSVEWQRGKQTSSSKHLSELEIYWFPKWKMEGFKQFVFGTWSLTRSSRNTARYLPLNLLLPGCPTRTRNLYLRSACFQRSFRLSILLLASCESHFIMWIPLPRLCSPSDIRHIHAMDQAMAPNPCWKGRIRKLPNYSTISTSYPRPSHLHLEFLEASCAVLPRLTFHFISGTDSSHFRHGETP